MTKMLTPDYFTQNTCLFKDNFLHEIPIDIQKTIMGEVEELDKQEAAIMEKLDTVFWGWQNGNPLYTMLNERLFNYEDGYVIGNDTHLSLWGFTYNILDTTLGFERDELYNSYKKYITNEVGLFNALSIYKKHYQHDFTIDDLQTDFDDDDDDNNPDFIYEQLMLPLVADKVNKLFSDDEWNMMSKYTLYTKLCNMRENEE